MRTVTRFFTEVLYMFLMLNLLFRLIPYCFFSSPRVSRTKGVGFGLSQPRNGSFIGIFRENQFNGRQIFGSSEPLRLQRSIKNQQMIVTPLVTYDIQGQIYQEGAVGGATPPNIFVYFGKFCYDSVKNIFGGQ